MRRQAVSFLQDHLANHCKPSHCPVEGRTRGNQRGFGTQMKKGRTKGAKLLYHGIAELGSPAQHLQKIKPAQARTDEEEDLQDLPL